MTWIELHRGAQAANDILRRIAPERIDKRRSNPLTEPGFLAIVRALAKDLIDAAETPEEQAKARALDALDRDWANLTPRQRDAAFRDVNRIIAGIAGQVSPELGALMRQHGGRLIGDTRSAMSDRYKLPVQTSLSAVDGRIIEHAASSQAFFVTDQYGKRGDATSAEARRIVEQGMAEGVDNRTIGGDLFAMVGDQLGRSRAYFDTVASIFIGRSRAYGQLASMEEAGIQRFAVEAVMDEVTCFAAGTPILMANGRTKRIERIEAGEYVMSCKGVPRMVRGTKRELARTWLTVRTAGERLLRVTQTHGILTQDGWIRARTLDAKSDGIAVYREDGACAARNLFGDDKDPEVNERAWGMRLGKQTAKTIAVAPWPHPLLRRYAQCDPIVDIDIETSGRRHDCFDLDVEEDRGYVANGLIVHNSAICESLHGKTFEVRAALQRYADVAASDDPEAVRELQPFVQHGVEADSGAEFLYFKRGEQRVKVADVVVDGSGRRRFENEMSEADLAAAGITAPPYHGRCRTTIVMVG